MLYEKWNSFPLTCDSFLLCYVCIIVIVCVEKNPTQMESVSSSCKKKGFENVFLTFKSFSFRFRTCIEFFIVRSNTPDAHSHKFHIFVNFLVSGFKENTILLVGMLSNQRTSADRWGKKLNNFSFYNITNVFFSLENDTKIFPVEKKVWEKIFSFFCVSCLQSVSMSVQQLYSLDNYFVALKIHWTFRSEINSSSTVFFILTCEWK